MAEYPVPVAPSGREGGFPKASAGLTGAFVEFRSAGPGHDVAVAHGLRRRPYGAVQVAWVGEVLYDPHGATAPVGLRAWTDEMCWFRPATAAGTLHRFLVF
jgi:hypothetical protein